MAQLKCSECSATSEDGQDWAKCPECERVYCDTCIEGMTKESKKMKILRDGDNYSRTVALCPSCKTDLLYF